MYDDVVFVCLCTLCSLVDITVEVLNGQCIPLLGDVHMENKSLLVHNRSNAH